MFNLSDPNVSFILFSPESNSLSESENKSNFEKACSILYSKDYTVISVLGYYKGVYEKSIIAKPKEDNNDILRQDSIYLMDTFNQESIILKYKNEKSSTKILQDGSEKPLSIAFYNEDTDNKTYLHNGISFSFIEEKKYHIFKDKSELKTGMIVEYFNDDEWKEKTILNVEQEYQNLYKLLIKYNKLRTVIP